MTISAGAQAASPGTSAANFLKMGLGARGSAMGDAQSAVSNDVNAAYWNPAGLTNLRFNEVSLMHYSLVESVRYQHASVGLPTDKGTFSGGVSYLDYGSIQGYDNSSNPTSDVKASNVLLSLAYARRPLPKSKLSLGANLKYLKSELAGYSASAPMADLGVLYPFEEGQLRGLILAAAMRNIGPSISYDNEDSSLPQQMVFGAGYSLIGGNLILDADFIRPKDNSAYTALGLEYRVFDILRIRAGYNNQSDFVGSGISYGMGLRFNQWNLDYAFVPYGDFGGTNRISVGIRWGRALEVQDAGDQVDMAYKKAQSLYAAGKGLEAYSALTDLASIAPWHKPSIELKAKIEKQFNEMASSKDKTKMDAEIADAFTLAKASFDRDELVDAKKGFEMIIRLQPGHIGSTVYLERIKNRYASLAHEAFKEGMAYYAAGDYLKAKTAFEKTLSIDPWHADAKAQLETTKQMIIDSTKREEEQKRLATAADGYRDGLTAFQKNDFETALKKFEAAQAASPDYEEVTRYLNVTKTSLSAQYLDQSKILLENGQYDEAVIKLKKAAELTPSDTRVISALEISLREQGTKNSEDSKRLYQEGLQSYLGGDVAKAEKNWKRALELDSNNEDALKAITKLEEQRAREKADSEK